MSTLHKFHKIIKDNTKTIDNTSEKLTPVVSICLITYNHAGFIQQALDSVLMQRTDYSMEIVVGDDFSTDGTSEIVLAYHGKYPDKIRVLLSRENLGKYTGNGRLNFMRTLKACRGDYIALLEGDDFWIDPLKLQKQIGFMKSNPNCSISAHNSVVLYDDGREPSVFVSDICPKFLSLSDVICHHRFTTASTVFRRCFVKKFPSWFYSLGLGDWPLYVLLAEYGDVGYIKEVMSAYRIHSGGVWYVGDSISARIRNKHLMIEFYECINRYFKYRYFFVIRENLASLYLSHSKALLKNGNRIKALYFCFKSIILTPSKISSWGYVLKSLLNLKKRAGNTTGVNC